ncbi:hypothetical protein OS493_006143 [Desmophyllum pertusum]|uniref:Uncharacterized protein n=1 Tax=Desmophyllum pertusum TaxID=174260 RepID=A0A9X0DAB0_9CNID|nr:hypothetical protein OS493_006143 [Desmophyllum pertusum]
MFALIRAERSTHETHEFLRITRSNGVDSGLVPAAESTPTSQRALDSASSNLLNTAGDQVASQVVEPCQAEAALQFVHSRHSMSNANVGTNSVESTANPQLEQHVERPREEREREEQREREEANRLMQLLFSPTEVPLPFDDFIMGSLDSNHNSAAEFWQDVDQARARMQEREREREARSIAEANRWCTCASGEVEEELTPICRRCSKHRYLYMGPASLSRHDECCLCRQDAFSGCLILPCSHKVHRDCVIAMIQNGM